MLNGQSRTGSTSNITINQPPSQAVFMQKLLVDLDAVDALLCEFESGEEDGVDDAGATHGDAEASVHAWVQELDLGPALLVFAADETVALVDAFGGVDWEDLVEVSESACQ
jgi:hypothetical protein